MSATLALVLATGSAQVTSSAAARVPLPLPPTTVAWSTPVVLSPDGGAVEESELVTDASGNVTVAWIDSGGWDGSGSEGLYVRRRSPSGIWGAIASIDQLAIDGLTMRQDSSGSVCILYQRYQRHARRLRGTCADSDGAFEKPFRLGTGQQPGTYGLVVDAKGNWTAAWPQGADDQHAQLAVARRVDGVWGKPVVMSRPGLFVETLDIDCSPEGVVTLAWAARRQADAGARSRIQGRTLARGSSWSRMATLSAPGAADVHVASRHGDHADVTWDIVRHGIGRIQIRSHDSTGWRPIHTLTTVRARVYLHGMATGPRNTTVVAWWRGRTSTRPGRDVAVVREKGQWGTHLPLTEPKGCAGDLSFLIGSTGKVWAFWTYTRRCDFSGNGWVIQSRAHTSAQGWSAIQDVSAHDALYAFPASAALATNRMPMVTWVSGSAETNWAYRTMYAEAS